MELFDFHHHDLTKNGIYNKSLSEGEVSTCFSIGIHPMDITEDWVSDFERIKEVSKQKKCVAIGECGLDNLVKVALPIQKEVFREHIHWANEIKKPVIIHCVRLFHELYSFSKIAKTPLIVHGYNKNKNIADTLIDKGFYLSFGRAVLYHVYLQEVVKAIPIDKLFLETDAQEFDIKDLYQKVALLRGISIEELVTEIDINKERVLYEK